MIVEFDKSFDKSLDRIKNKSLYPRIERLIFQLERSDSIQNLPSTKKLTGYKTYYRIRLGEYRIGFEKIDEHSIRLIIIAHRKDIYKFFP